MIFTHLFPVTRFIPPNGRTEAMQLGTHDQECARMVDAVLETGRARFTVEILRTGDISLCCEDHEHDDGDIACEIVYAKYAHSGSDVFDTMMVEKIDMVIRAAHKHFFPAPETIITPAPNTGKADPRVLIFDEDGIHEVSFDTFLQASAKRED